MKHCVRFEELISAYIDNELDTSDKSFIEEHLKSCADCSNLFVLYREMSISFTETIAPAPPDLSDKVMDILRNSNYIPRREPIAHVKTHEDARKLFNRYFPIAACLAIAILALPFFLNNNREANDFAAPEAAMAPAAMLDALDDEAVVTEMDFGAFLEVAEEEWASDALAPAGTPEASPAPQIMPDVADDTDIAASRNEDFEDGERFIFDLDIITETYYAYIEIDHDPPETVFRTRLRENYFLVRKTDVAELYDLLNEFVRNYIPGNEHAEFALVLFME